MTPWRTHGPTVQTDEVGTHTATLRFAAAGLALAAVALASVGLLRRRGT